MNNNKPTILERYWKIRLDSHDNDLETMPTPSQLWKYQELLYRIEVLEIFKRFSAAVPISDDMKVLTPHYQVVNAFIENLKSERKFPSAANEDVQKQRITAYESFSSIIEDYRKRYGSYVPQSPEQYQRDIVRTIGTVLPAWIQYRNTINEIKLTEEKA